MKKALSGKIRDVHDTDEQRAKEGSLQRKKVCEERDGDELAAHLKQHFDDDSSSFKTHNEFTCDDASANTESTKGNICSVQSSSILLF